MTKRIPLSKKTRFEVLKRDSFKCQYCGECAPTVLLHVDHIKPVAEGGSNDVINLITSCEGCNLGKGARELSDDTVIIKARTQLEALQERREQLEMMMEWQGGLASIEADGLVAVLDLWRQLATGFQVSDFGVGELRKIVGKFGPAEVAESMRIAGRSYLKTQDGAYTRESVALALSKIGGICKSRKMERDDPESAEVNKIRWFIQKRHSEFRAWETLSLLKAAKREGVTMDTLWDIANACSSYYSFKFRLEDAIKAAKGEA